MSILDDAIREHLELKRAHGADESELKKLEDEAFGPPSRPEEPDPFAEAPTEFMSAEAPAAEETDAEGRRRINIADLQEPPAPAPAPEEPEAAPAVPAEDAGQASPPAEETLAAEEPAADERPRRSRTSRRKRTSRTRSPPPPRRPPLRRPTTTPTRVTRTCSRTLPSSSRTPRR